MMRVRHYFNLLAVCGFIVLGLPTMLSVYAQTNNTSESKNALSKLDKVSDFLTSQSFRTSVPAVIDRVSAGQRKRFPVHLTSDARHALIASCGLNCSHVQISLYYQDVLMMSSKESNDVVIISGEPKYKGLYEAEISVPGCLASECEVGLLIMQQQTDGSKPQALPYRRYENRDLDGGDIATIKSIDREESCESACRQNAQCRAYSFDKWNRYCFLKAQISSLRLDPRSVSGVSADVVDPPLASIDQMMERYRGRAFPPGGYKHMSATQFEICERMCQTDDGCIAYTFSKDEQICRFYKETAQYMPDAASVSGGKIQPAKQVAQSVNAARAPQNDSHSDCANVAGYWRWFTGDMVGINANGTTQPSPTGIHGEWRCSAGVYVFKWSHGFTDRLTLSPDGRRLSGHNNVGAQVWGVRN